MSRNTITIRSVYGKVNQLFYVQPVKDPKTKRYPDCVKKVNSQGDMILTDKERNSGKYFVAEDETFVLQDGTTFDLDDEVEATKWKAIINHPFIAKDRFAKNTKGDFVIDGNRKRYGIADLYIDKIGEGSTLSNNRARLRVKAAGYVFEDSAEKLLTKCKVLGRPMDYAHPQDVVDYLLKESEKNPNRIIDLYEGSDMKHRILVIDAISKNVIVIKNKIYMYGDNVNLGASQDMVIQFFKERSNKKIYDMISKETYPEMESKEK